MRRIIIRGLLLGFLVFTCHAQPVVLLQTNVGDIAVELFAEDSPITVDNFRGYVNAGFYDGLIFHRVVGDFVIQGGGFDPDLYYKQPADPIINESANGIMNDRGTVAMARYGNDLDSASSQFFINLDDNNDLEDYCVFGRVISDMNVVYAIAAEPNGTETSPDLGTLQNVPNGPNSPILISRAFEIARVAGDLDEDYKVDFRDFTAISNNWLKGETKTISNRGQTMQISADSRCDLSGDIFVWQDDRGGSDDIYGYNLSDGNEIAISTDANTQKEVAVSGNIVVWRNEHGGYYDIYGYNRSDANKFAVCEQVFPAKSPAVSGDIVVWYDYRNYHTEQGGVKLKTDIYGRDMSDVNGDPNGFSICTSIELQTNPAIDGNSVVWEDYRNGNCDIYGADISNPDSPTEFPVCTAIGNQYNPAVLGDIVVWEDYRYGDANMAIYGYDTTTQSEFAIAFGPVSNSDVSDSVVVWQVRRNGNWDIYGYDVIQGVEFPISVADGNQVEPVIDGNTVAWLDSTIITNDLYWRQLCDNYYKGDINGDCKVDMDDVVIVISNWLEDGLEFLD
ncbi:MAG: peptidylprolyl isomerase [Planctomycetota bacterium]|jgi:beta propeller repeat protein